MKILLERPKSSGEPEVIQTSSPEEEMLTPSEQRPNIQRSSVTG